MKPRTFRILERAVEEGFRMGYQRAFKYVDTPNEATIEENVIREIMNAVCEVFIFDDDVNEK